VEQHSPVLGASPQPAKRSPRLVEVGAGLRCPLCGSAAKRVVYDDDTSVLKCWSAHRHAVPEAPRAPAAGADGDDPLPAPPGAAPLAARRWALTL